MVNINTGQTSHWKSLKIRERDCKRPSIHMLVRWPKKNVSFSSPV
jgi:hypothetical protein